jgi:hypothetical protein
MARQRIWEVARKDLQNFSSNSLRRVRAENYVLVVLPCARFWLQLAA